MNVINLTPHAIRLIDQNTGEEVTIRQSKTIRPIRINRPVYHDVFIDVKGVNIPVKIMKESNKACSFDYIPPPQPNTVYIVSRLVAEAFKSTRPDFVFPHKFQRGDKGAIMGCYSLARFE